MVIKVGSEKDYIYQWIRVLQPIYKLTERETQVAQMMAFRFLLMSRGDKKPRQAMALLKSANSLKFMCVELGMNFPAFRKYLVLLKEKGFFEAGAINPMFVPTEKKVKIVVEWTEHPG